MAKGEQDGSARWYESVVRRVVFAVAGLAVGAAVGVGVEGHTNDVARLKVVTAETCLDAIPHEETIPESLVECLQDGVPGGAPIGDLGASAFREGQSIRLVNGYIVAQRIEADSIEPGRLALWSVVPFAAGAIFLSIASE